MLPVSLARTLLATASTLALLSACGGGDAPDARSFALRIARGEGAATGQLGPPTAPQGAPAAAAISSAMVFNYAQTAFPTLFPAGTAAPDFSLFYEGKNFDVRGWANGNFLGVANGEIWGLGPYTGQVLTSFGPVSNYACQILPSSCEPPPPPTGAALNECFDRAYSTLPTGFKMKLTYVHTGTITGEQQVETEIKGPATFKGQSAVLVESVIKGSTTVPGIGVTVNNTVTNKSYEVPTSNEPPLLLGGITTSVMDGYVFMGVTVPATTSASETVFNPAWKATEYTLQPGQSVTRSQTSTTTVTAPQTLPPVTGTVTLNFKFEDKPTVTVQGKTYSTCRYSQTDGPDLTQTWYLLGKGVPVKSLTTRNGATLGTMELKSGTYNGVAL